MCWWWHSSPVVVSARWFERGGGRLHGWGVVAARGPLSFMGPWLGHRCGGQGVIVREGVVVCLHLWEVLVVALVARGG